LYDSSRKDDITQASGHLDQLFACLLATKSFFDAWSQVPSSVYISLHFVAWAQLAKAIVSFSRLLLYDCRDWDLEHVRQLADFSSRLGQVANRVDEARSAMLVENDGLEAEDVLSFYARRVRWVKRWYESKIVAEITHTSSPLQNDRPIPADEVMTGDVSSLGEMFWQELVSEWEDIPTIWT